MNNKPFEIILDKQKLEVFDLEIYENISNNKSYQCFPLKIIENNNLKAAIKLKNIDDKLFKTIKSLSIYENKDETKYKIYYRNIKTKTLYLKLLKKI